MTNEIERAIERVTRTLAGKDVRWAFTGSAGHALQGADLQPEDLDVQTDERGAYRIVELLSEYCTCPVEYREAEVIRSHFGKLQLEGVEVEVMGGVQTRASSGTWTEPVDVGANRVFVGFHGLSVPVMSLAHEVLAYERLGRHERAAVLRSLIEGRR